MALQVLQIVIGSLNMVTGLLAVTYYALYVGPTGLTTSPITLLQISLFAFIFGVLSFALACLAALPIFNARPAVQPVENVAFEGYAPQVTTREYVRQRRQTISEQAYVGLACPSCGRIVSRDDNFCDNCGTQFREAPQAGVDVWVEAKESA